MIAKAGETRGSRTALSNHTNEVASFTCFHLVFSCFLSVARMDITKTATYIGLNDLAVQGVFEWSDGTQVRCLK